MPYDLALDAAEDDDAAPRSTRRARRVQRQLRQVKDGELNIVSMIDVFAVLVFFLLVSSSIAAARLNILSLDLPGKSAVAKAAPPLRHPEINLLPDALMVNVGDGISHRIAKTKAGYDVMALSTLLVAAKKAAPAFDKANLMVAPDVAYEELVAVMDAVRQAPDKGELYPRIAVGDLAAAVQP